MVFDRVRGPTNVLCNTRDEQAKLIFIGRSNCRFQNIDTAGERQLKDFLTTVAAVDFGFFFRGTVERSNLICEVAPSINNEIKYSRK